MPSHNPILANAERNYAQTANNGPGFAYQEGRAALGSNQAAALGGMDAATQQNLEDLYQSPSGHIPGRTMGIDDVVVKTAISFGVLLVGAVIGWQLAASMGALVFIAGLIALGLGMANAFKKQVSPPLVLAYAAVEGVFLGAISRFYQSYGEANGDGNLVAQAVFGTLVVFGVMLTLYKTGVIKVTQRFRKIMTVALVSYLVIALANLVASLFGVGGGWGFAGVGTLGIVMCLGAVALASFSLVMDFDGIERATAYGVPERESWRMAFGLMVTLVWLYLELLRLLAILSRD